MHAIDKRSFQYSYYLIKSLIFFFGAHGRISSYSSRGHPSKVVEIRKCETWVGEPSSLPCIKNTAFREGTPPLVSPFRTISTIFSKGASYWLLESTRGRRFCIQFYNISAYMALTLDILSLVNNIKIIEFSKICWIGLEFFLVYIYLNYNIYIHTCDTFIPVKIYI